MKHAGRLENDDTKQIPQDGTKIYAHNETQTVVAKRRIDSPGCIWEIVTDYKKKYLRIQDLKMSFGSLENVKIYITSYFRPDKESNTIYPD